MMLRRWITEHNSTCSQTCRLFEAVALDRCNARDLLVQVPESAATKLDDLGLGLSLEQELDCLLHTANSLNELLDLENLGGGDNVSDEEIGNSGGALNGLWDEATLQDDTFLVLNVTLAQCVLDDQIGVTEGVLSEPLVCSLVTLEENLIRDGEDLIEKELDGGEGLGINSSHLVVLVLVGPNCKLWVHARCSQDRSGKGTGDNCSEELELHFVGSEWKMI